VTATKEIVMRALSLMLVLGVSAGSAVAQPPAAGSAAQPLAAGSAAPAAGSAAPAVGSAAPAPGTPDPAAAPTSTSAPAPAPSAPTGSEPSDGGALRKTCVDAMNANESFARSIVQTALQKEAVFIKAMCEGVDTIKAHQEAASDIEKNKRHVIGAYAAMWVIAGLFLLYLLQRQQRLKAEIAQLRRDLDAAAKDGKGDK
jgi:hypothetical protein